MDFNPSTIAENAAPYPALLSSKKAVAERRPRGWRTDFRGFAVRIQSAKGSDQDLLPIVDWPVTSFVSMR
jgi:hypothetical protein